VRDQRPFSLDLKLDNLDSHLPAGRRICELRLLAVKPTHRKTTVFRGLVDLVVRYGRAQGYDLAIISGTVRQQKLYGHLGFTPFGPLVGTGEALFQPMYLTIEQFEERVPVLAAAYRETLNFLPGPVMLAREVRTAFERTPVSHRNEQFKTEFRRIKTRLCELAGSSRVEILLGSGTLANDFVGAQLSLLEAPGVVLSNGEFGDRLIDQATRFRLAHEAIAVDWGVTFDAGAVEAAIDRTGARWIWAVASETSTGMLNDIAGLKAIAARRGVKLCLDCVSAIGAVPLDLSGVYLASGASGKALAALPGLSFVFYNHDVAPAPTRLPRYLDLGYYADKDGIPFTHSSNLIAALDIALRRFDTDEPFTHMAALSAWLRPRLRDMGLPILVDGRAATPAIVTIPLPAEINAMMVGDTLQQYGMLVSYQSEYLASRNWLQIGLMGHCELDHLERLLSVMRQILSRDLAAISA
jgi:aspartate aminotransferase-like enzyme